MSILDSSARSLANLKPHHMLSPDERASGQAEARAQLTEVGLVGQLQSIFPHHNINHESDEKFLTGAQAASENSPLSLEPPSPDFYNEIRANAFYGPNDGPPLPPQNPPSVIVFIDGHQIRVPQDSDLALDQNSASSKSDTSNTSVTSQILPNGTPPKAQAAATYSLNQNPSKISPVRA